MGRYALVSSGRVRHPLDSKKLFVRQRALFSIKPHHLHSTKSLTKPHTFCPKILKIHQNLPKMSPKIYIPTRFPPKSRIPIKIPSKSGVHQKSHQQILSKSRFHQKNSIKKIHQKMSSKSRFHQILPSYTYTTPKEP